MALLTVGAAIMTGPRSADARSMLRQFEQWQTLSGSYEDPWEACKAEATFQQGVGLRSGARHIQYTPGIGDTRDSGRVSITGVDYISNATVHRVRWTFVGRGNCYGGGSDIQVQFRAGLRYLAPFRVNIRSIQFTHRASRALGRVFGSSWNYASGSNISRFSCRRSGTVSATCLVSWFIGDMSMKGKVKLRFFAAQGFLKVANRVSIRKTNHYCQIRHSTCTRKIRKSFTLPVPWSEYEYYRGLGVRAR